MKILVSLMALVSLSAFSAETTVRVKGMVCSMCVQGIEKKFKGAGVEKVSVNLDEKVVRFEGKDLSDKTIEKLITEAGYNVDSISRK